MTQTDEVALPLVRCRITVPHLKCEVWALLEVIDMVDGRGWRVLVMQRFAPLALVPVMVEDSRPHRKPAAPDVECVRVFSGAARGVGLFGCGHGGGISHGVTCLSGFG